MCVPFKLHYDSFEMHLVLLKMCANVTIKQKQTKLKALWTSQKKGRRNTVMENKPLIFCLGFF